VAIGAAIQGGVLQGDVKDVLLLDAKTKISMDTTEAPQMLEHASQTLSFTPFDVKWIPSSARFILFGQSPRAKGVFNVYYLE
jgi:hypothetical protein